MTKNLKYDYTKINPDLTGADVKNRFRIELLWGLDQLIQLFYDNIEGCVVFDYNSDIEIHKNGEIEFYEVKTKSTQSLTTNAILKCDKSESILCKLYRKRYQDGVHHNQVILGIVSNLPLSHGNTKYSDTTEFPDFDESHKLLIVESLSNELDIKNIDLISLSNLYFVYTAINLNSPVDYLKGRLTTVFADHIPYTKNINTFYNYLYTTIYDKSTVAKYRGSIDEVRSDKGLSTNDIKNHLKEYNQTPKDIATKSIAHINNNNNKTIVRLNLLKDLNHIVKTMDTNYIIKDKYDSIVAHLEGALENNDTLLESSLSQIINNLVRLFSFDEVEYNLSYSEALCIYAYYTFEENL